jgi:DNA-binding LacI/PurR family transcriptional regulator
VLNGRYERMRPETTERVMQAIAQLGYTPNQLARQLKTGNVAMIGLIVPSVANPFWGAVARHVEEAAQLYGYQTLLCNGERNPEHEQRYSEILWSSGVRGIIFGSSTLSFDHIIPLTEKGMQVVAFDRRAQSSDKVVVDSVSMDNVFGARLAVNHLLELGHQRIGFLSGPLATVSRLDRLEGYHQALRDAGITPDPELIWQGAAVNSFGDIEGFELGRAGTHTLLSLPNRPTALLAVNDMYAFGAYAGARDLGLRIPESISIVGFDDLVPLTEITVPALTTVRQPLSEMMRSAVELLIGRLEKTHTGSPEQVTMKPEFVLRASTSLLHSIKEL